MNIQAWITGAAGRLSAAGVPSARLDAELLLTHCLSQTRTWLHAHTDTPLNRGMLDQADMLLERRLRREPMAYVLGYKEFYGRQFTVTPDVLIPRPESEATIELLKAMDPKPKSRLLDVGTGSGCLGITAALEIPSLDVTLSDISLPALAVAADNARRLDAVVAPVHSDLLAEFASRQTTFDIIVANLPYVDHDWKRSLETAFEPALALFADDGGLELILRLIPQAVTILGAGGRLFLEADPEQHERIITHGTQNGLRLETVRDYIVVLGRP